MKTLKAAIAGQSLSHSISPDVHRAIFPILRARTLSGFDQIDYNILECETEDVFRFHVKHGGEWGFTGMNVTYPYKHLAAILARDGDATTRKIQSGNTLRFGMNFSVLSTDGPGFWHAMEKERPDLDTKEYRLVIIGSGGAARAVLNSALERSWRSVVVAVRNVETAKEQIGSLGDFTIVPIAGLMRDEGSQFVIHATPIGQQSAENLLEGFAWNKSDIVADLVYNPVRTRLLEHAAEAGAFTVTGLGMLLEQAALSQHYWHTGKVASTSVLTAEEYAQLKQTLEPLLAPRWDAFAS